MSKSMSRRCCPVQGEGGPLLLITLHCARSLFVSASVVALALNAFAAAPNVTRVSPTAIAPGKATVVTLFGDDLQGAVDLWTSFPCELEPASSSSAAFKLELPKHPRAAIGAIRLVTTNGLSSLHLLLIDSVPTVESSKTNRTRESAQQLANGMAADGACEELRSDFYRVTAKKGQRLLIEAVAHRLGSPLDPLLRLLDAQGRELALNDDAPGLGPDAMMDFRCPKAGDYFIEVRDTRHAGGARHRYRLRIGAPLPTPLPFLASPEFAELTKPLERLPLTNEIEPNDEQARAQIIHLPTKLSGSLNHPGDRDVFEFQAAKGERMVFTGQTRSLGAPGDLFLQLQTTNGTKLAEANASSADEGIITNRFNADGTYRLVVEELNQNGGPRFAYRIGMRRLLPGFALGTETERVSTPAGDSIEIEVKAERREYDGPIQLVVKGLPEGFTVTNAVLAAKTNSAKLKIGAPPNLALGDFYLFSVVGIATIAGEIVSERTSTLPALRTLFPDLRHPPTELDGLIALSVSESKSATPTRPQRRRRN